LTHCLMLSNCPYMRDIPESDCIRKSNTLRLGYETADFQLCLNGEWNKVKDHYIKSGTKQKTASKYITQIRHFFEASEDTIWITFYDNKLWWTKAKAGVSLNNDNIRERSCISEWSDKDIEGNPLYMENISGNLLKTQGFRGTICTVEEEKYLLRKINAEKSKEVLETEDSYKSLQQNLCNLIQQLTWQDFEVLVDLIFTQAGWQRVSSVGKTAKTLDLDLKAPVTGEKCLVQVKSSTDSTELDKYLKDFSSMDQYHKFYYVYHTFKGTPSQKINDSKVRLLSANEIAELAIDSDLSKWIIAKVS
ncbi:MAG: restriction endonuclease, partial [Bdellovibrionales bacterium]|nr:restriction endonuclease [Bdellovibrionales bacterium]